MRDMHPPRPTGIDAISAACVRSPRTSRSLSVMPSIDVARLPPTDSRRCDRLWRAGPPWVRRNENTRAGLAGVSSPAPAAVSFVVSFAEIRERPLSPVAYGHPRSRTAAAGRERHGAHLESALGATPREFESRILRYAHLGQYEAAPEAASLGVLTPVSILVSFGCPRSAVSTTGVSAGCRPASG